ERRHSHRGDQTGHIGDGSRGQRPPLRRAGRSDQSRHPVRRIPDASVNETLREPRDLALQALYQADRTGEPGSLEDLPPRARRLVEGVLASVEDLDREIAEASTHWSIERMPVIDRAILRLGLYELRHVPGTPPAVVVNE